MTAAEREARILSLEPQVMMLAKARRRSLSCVNLDELISAAWVGAIAAVDSFDNSRGVDLGTYAAWRIRGAIGDYLRSLDPLSRHHRRSVKRGAEDAPAIFSVDATRHDINHNDLPVLGVLVDEHAAQDNSRQEARLTLQALYRRAKLRPRNAAILQRYMEGEKMLLIGQSLGVGESCISQICSRTVAKLRAAA
jgi:RNA polymerase sigma factor for flagellar operon FliA